MKKIYLLGYLLLAISATRAQNNAVTFNGTSQYIDCGTNVAYAANTIRTMECWVKFGTTSGDREILSKSISGQGIELLQFGGNLAVYCMYNGSNASYMTYPMSNFKTGTWYHLAFSWNGTKESMKLYVNGVSVGTVTHIGNINTTGIANPSSSFRIGQWAGTPNRYFQGSIDEVRVWNVSRTAAEIKKGMFGTVATNATGLVSYYKLNEGSGTTAANSTATTGLTGSLINSPSWTASPVQNGSNALRFGSSNEHIVLPANPLLNLTTGTIECWIKPSAMSYNGCIMGVRGPAGTRFSFHINTDDGSIGLWNNDDYIPIAYNFIPEMWYHLAFVCDDITTRFYVNGIDIGETGTAFSNLTGLPLVIGIAKNQAYDSEGTPTGEALNEAFLGEMDEVRIWNTVRTPSEINSYKDISLSGAEAGLVAQYTFNQGIAGGNNSGLGTIMDQSNNNLHGTLTNFSLAGTTSNFVSHNMILLPVKWASFNAVKKGETVDLQWQTALEQDNRLFFVERSANGESFMQIGTVPANGEPAFYQYTDRQPLPGSNYYRIKQVDKNGRASFSAVRAVTVATHGALTCMDQQNGSFTLVLKGGANEAFFISDVSGRVVQQGKLTGGRTVVSQLHRGTYIATVLQGEKKQSTRFVVR